MAILVGALPLARMVSTMMFRTLLEAFNLSGRCRSIGPWTLESMLRTPLEVLHATRCRMHWDVKGNHGGHFARVHRMDSALNQKDDLPFRPDLTLA